MASIKPSYEHIVLCFMMVANLIIISQASSMAHNNHHLTPSLYVNGPNASNVRPIPPLFFGIFFEEINHAGVGGLWAELVSNTGFEAGGSHTPPTINPWGVIGDKHSISVATERSSCFRKNPIALRMDIHCNQATCPSGGVGVYNPGYWGMNIVKGKSYKVVFHVKSTGPLEGVLSLVSEGGTSKVLASQNVIVEAERVKNWTRIEIDLKARGSYTKSRLQFTTRRNGTIWLDQVSAIPHDTYKGHGFRIDLMKMLINLKPRFLRFPGGCYVEGQHLRNAFRWKETVGPWEERPGHFGDTWNYWSDDGLGFLEYLLLAEDLRVEPVWVVHSGISTQEQVDSHQIAPFVQEMLDGIEFARGSPNSTWGSLRAKLGHPAPFSLKYVAIGNEACQIRGYYGYKDIYLQFYSALRKAYPDIKIISNCDASQRPLDHPADIFDVHRYETAEGMLQLTNLFEKTQRGPHAPKAFVSEYAVTLPESKVKNGTFKGALAEAAFLLSLEQNSDVVDMVSYAPLFANLNHRDWDPNAIFFDSTKAYGISSYWVQTFFKQSSGASLLHVNFHNHSKPNNIYVTAINWLNKQDRLNYILIKVVNFNNYKSNFKVTIDGVDARFVKIWKETVLACNDLEADNTYDHPTKVVPVTKVRDSTAGEYIDLLVQPYSFTAFELVYYPH